MKDFHEEIESPLTLSLLSPLSPLSPLYPLSFSKLILNDLDEHFKSLDPKKTTVENDTITKILIDTKEIANGYLTIIYRKCIDNQTFPLSLKKADVIPSHKQLERTNAKNYRPVSLLPCISKLYERDMYNQIKCYHHIYLASEKQIAQNNVLTLCKKIGKNL